MNPPAIILLVDDVAANRETLRELFATESYQLMEAADGPTALQLAAETPPDLVLLDVIMPGMDGYEVCRRLRADASLAEVPVIMVTAYDEQAARLAGLEAGADDFITKPFNRVELRARVRTITRLNRYRRLNEQRQQFQWIVEQAPDGYILVNAADEILFANARARLWLGLHPDNGEVTNEKFLSAASRTFHGQPAKLWQGWPDIPAAALTSPRLLVRPETPQARAFFLEVSVHESTGGRLLRLCDATGRLAARHDRRSFQTMVSHKLRTPLNGLLGPLEMMAAAGLAPEQMAEIAALAYQSAARLRGAVDEVLRFAELSQLPAPGAGFALAGLDALVRSVAAGLALPEVSVSVAAEARAASIACAPAALEWVLCELLENARKFHPRGTPTVRVAATLDAAGGVCLTVDDDGRTLSPEQLALAGQPYFQGEKSFTGEAPGMGLGLASVCALLWQAGGACRLRNRGDGPGVCVELTWPPADAGSAHEPPHHLTTDHRLTPQPTR
jgi:DNA-binding response OmpR family regulator